jgi:hypothetical protein
MFLSLLQFFATKFLVLALHLESGSFPRPLSAREETEAFSALRAGDPAAREKLIRHNLRLAAHIVKKYYALPGDQDDLISIGTIGLMKAVDTFDSDVYCTNHDWNTLDKILELDAPSYYMMNILDDYTLFLHRGGGAFLRRYREAKGWNRQQLADHAKVSRTSIRCWESGQKTISQKCFCHLVENLGSDFPSMLRM